MIANITKGNGFHGCVAYVLGKEEAEIITTNMAGETPAQLAREFRLFANANERVKKPVLHISINPNPSDRILDDWEMCMITQDLLDGLGLSKNQFIAVKHNDTEFDGKPRPHIHLVVNRVDYEGKCNDDYLEFIRTQKILRQIEHNYGLTIQRSSWEVEDKKVQPKHLKLGENTREINTFDKIKDAIRRAAADQPEMPTFVSLLLKENIEARFHFTRTGKIKGVSYGMDGQAFRGGELGNLYSHIGIQNKLKVNYKEEYQNEILSLIANHKPENNTNSDSTDSNDSTNEAITSISQEATSQNNDNTIVTSIPKILRTDTKDEAKKESIINNAMGGNSPNNAQPTRNSIDDTDSQSTPTQQNNYVSIIPPIEERFPSRKEEKTKTTRTKTTDTTESQATVPPELESIPDAIVPKVESIPDPIVATTNQSILNAEAVQYAQIVAGYMVDKDKLELKGNTLHATFEGCETLIVKRRDTNETILAGTYSLNGQWNITKATQLTEKQRSAILQLEQQNPTQELQRPDTGIDNE